MSQFPDAGFISIFKGGIFLSLLKFLSGPGDMLFAAEHVPVPLPNHMN